MYRVVIINGNTSVTIHDASASKKRKLSSGKITREPNSISSFSFELYPHNIGYSEIIPLQTQVHVWNINKQRYEFKGRVLKAYPEMDGNGIVIKRVICEDRLGYLNDSIQPYVAMTHYTGDATRTGLEQFIDVVLGYHNAHVEVEKRIYRGRVTVVPFKTTNDVTKQLNYQTTWTALREKLPLSFGGYLVLREEEGTLYLDYLEEVGATRTTAIALGRNMKSASRELDPTNVITRLYPLGAKIKAIDETGQEVETEERVSIRSVNGGRDYIDAAEYIEQFGIIEGTYIWDDVTLPNNLLTRGLLYLTDSNGIYATNRITALDLSLLGLDPDDFVLFDRYPVVNSLIGLNDTLQIVKQTIDIVQPEQSSFDMGDTVRRMSDLIADSQSPARGEAGRSSYLHIRYSENASGADMTTAPTAATKYIGLAETTSPIAPVDYTAYTWSSFAGQEGQSSYTHIRYSASADGSNMTVDPDNSTKYIGICVTTSATAPTSASAYAPWKKYVGDDGDPGTSSYTHIRYSANSDGSNMTATPDSNTKYIGICVTTSATAPTSASAYAPWKKYVGEDGNPGANSYMHVRYSANSDGSNMTTSPTSSTKYIGICVTTSATAPTSASAYAPWKKYVGDDGTSVTILGSYASYADLVAAHWPGTTGDAYIVNGNLYVWSTTAGTAGDWIDVGQIQGPAGDSGTSSYLYVRYSASADGSNMTSSPTSSTKYIGICVTTSPTAPTSASAYAPWKKYVGEDGLPGTSSYTHVRYSASADGSNMTSSPTSSTKYIGIYVSPVAVPSTDPDDYAPWMKYIGDDGISITSTTPYYAKGSSPSVKPSNPSIPAWTVQAPALSYGEYLWCAYLVTYSTGSPQWTEPFNLRSADELIQADSEPANPTEGTLWLDTSSDIYTLMRFNGTDWDIVADTTEQMNDIFTRYDSQFENFKKTLDGLTEEYGAVTTSVSDTQQIVETLKTALDMDANGVSLNFQRINESITTIDGNVNTQRNTLERYIRFVDGTIELGEIGSATILKLENDELGFYQNGVRVAYFNSGKLYVDKLEAITSLQLGRYAFVPNSTGGMSLKYTGA